MGVTIFLVLLLFAVQLTINLYATSTVTAVAFDAARQVAGSTGGPKATTAAEANARSILDAFEEGDGRLEFEWDTDGDDAVRLTVRAERPSLLAGLTMPFERVERTISVRWERAR